MSGTNTAPPASATTTVDTIVTNGPELAVVTQTAQSAVEVASTLLAVAGHPDAAAKLEQIGVPTLSELSLVLANVLHFATTAHAAFMAMFPSSTIAHPVTGGGAANPAAQ